MNAWDELYIQVFQLKFLTAVRAYTIWVRLRSLSAIKPNWLESPIWPFGAKTRDAWSVVYHRRVVLLSEATIENLVTPKYFNWDWILECQAKCQNHVTLKILLWTGPQVRLRSSEWSASNIRGNYSLFANPFRKPLVLKFMQFNSTYYSELIFMCTVQE